MLAGYLYYAGYYKLVIYITLVIISWLCKLDGDQSIQCSSYAGDLNLDGFSDIMVMGINQNKEKPL